ncbi:MAG: ATP-dependent DNA ligase [Thermoplasmatota archaeon]
MLYERLVAFYDRLDATSKRLELTRVLVELFGEAEDADEVSAIVMLTQGKVAPDFEGVELGMAEKLVLRAVVFATGLPETKVTQEYRDKGDAGDAAEELLRRATEGQGKKRGPKAARQITLFDSEEAKAPKVLTVGAVFGSFREIAAATGPGSQEKKLDLLQSMLLTSSPRAARYIVRTVTGKLRLGIADQTLLEALARRVAGDPGVTSVADMTETERATYEAAKSSLEHAFNVTSDLARVARALTDGGLAAVARLRLTPGVPVRAMLAERLPSSAEILEKMGGRAAVEVKYDGLRTQAHVPEVGAVKFFSRRLENVTDQFPDVADALRAGMRAGSAIVEGEVVAYDPATDEIGSFQEVAKRRRKLNVSAAVVEVPIGIFLFDALSIDGEDLTERPYLARRERLKEAFPETERVRWSEMQIVESVEALDEFFLTAVARGGEGVMVKSLAPDSVYRAGARGFQWIKLKREYRAELADSLDLVAVGAFTGRGRRTGRYGALLMAAYNAEEDVFETVCKLGTGFDDAALEEMPRMFESAVRADRHPRVRSTMEANVWFTPQFVAEVVGAELTLSPTHTAALGELKEASGLALRFPRFTGNWRRDKSPEDATTTRELVEMYRGQRTERDADADESTG